MDLGKGLCLEGSLSGPGNEMTLMLSGSFELAVFSGGLQLQPNRNMPCSW